MLDVINELNEKLKELCESMDIDPKDYVVVDRTSYEVHVDVINELAAFYDFGIESWENYEKAMNSLKE